MNATNNDPNNRQRLHDIYARNVSTLIDMVKKLPKKEQPEDDNNDVREWQQADYLTEQEKEEGVLLSPEELDRRILGERLANTDPPSGAPFFPTYKLKGESGGRILGKRTKRTKRRKTSKRRNTSKRRKTSKRRNRK